MKRSNVIGILAAAAVIVLSVVLISWYLTKRTPTLIQGTVECTTYKASSKVPGRIDDMKVAQGDRVEKGDIKFVPERFTKNYMNWMKGTRDWCISRQLWWGHRIPAYYCDDCGETVVTIQGIER